MPRTRKSPAARGAVRVSSPVGSEYRPQVDDEESGIELQEVGARRWTRQHGMDKTCLPTSCWRAIVIIILVLILGVAIAAAVFAILAWAESDEIASTMAKLGGLEGTMASALGLVMNQTHG